MLPSRIFIVDEANFTIRGSVNTRIVCERAPKWNPATAFVYDRPDDRQNV